MSGADAADRFDEFDFIADTLRPLTRGSPEALELKDDAAVLAARPGWELVVTTDTVVQGVHVLSADPLDLVARKLLRVNLSDLAAKGAEPYGYFLNVSWPHGLATDGRRAFAAGLEVDGTRYGLSLFGGDTTSTPGPLVASVTLLGWTPQGRMVRRAGARPGDRVLVSGAIGDGWLGLQAAQGRLQHLASSDIDDLARRYRLPQPRLELSDLLRAHASAAADISDGLVADAAHVAVASGVGMRLDLERLPVSPAAAAWLARQPDEAQARTQLATGGDDYEIVCTAPAAAAAALVNAAAQLDGRLTDIGEVVDRQGVQVVWRGRTLEVQHTGWRHD